MAKIINRLIDWTTTAIANVGVDITNKLANVSHGDQSITFAYENDHPNTIEISAMNENDMAFMADFPTKTYVDNEILTNVGDLSNLMTTDQSNIVAALNEVKSSRNEPFRIKNWGANNLNVVIPCCTEDIGNTSIDKMVFKIEGQEAIDYQVVGMIAYEVFDAQSGGNRINCWPVCQFTGENTTELSVRWMCGGTTRKTAKRVSAWVLLMHR